MPRNKKIVIAVAALALIGIITVFTVALRRGATFLSVLTTTRDVFLLLLEIVGIVLLLVLTIAMFRWLRRKPEGTLILAFETVDGGEKENKAKFDGKSISDSLNAELLRILQIHTEEQDEAEYAPQAAAGPINENNASDDQESRQSVTTRSVTGASPEGSKRQSAVNRPKPNILFQGPGLKTTSENLTPSFADSVTVGVGGATVSIGRLLLAFKQISSNRDPEIIISGSLQRFGKVARLVARIDRCAYPLLICEVSRTVENEDQIPDLVRDLAFKIWQETSKTWEDKAKTSAKTWTGFKYFTEALNATQQFSVTGRDEDLRDAAAHCLAAVREEKGYQNLFYVCYNLGRSSFEQGDYPMAEALFLGAILIHDGATLEGEAKNRVADAFNGYGASLAWQGKNADAERAYRQAIKFRELYSDAYVNLIIALVDLGWAETAKKELDKALELHLLDELSSTELGDLYSSLGFRAEAMETYKTAIKEKPSNGYAHFQLGNLYSDEQLFDEAIDEYEQAIHLVPGNASARNALGVVYDNQGRHEEAIAQYEEAIELDPEMALPHNNLGIIYDKMGFTDEAIAAYRRAIELDDRFSIPHYNLGLIYSNQGKTKDAISELEKAIALDDTHASSHEWLAFVYTNDKQLEKAVTETQRALELDPSNRRLTASLAGLYKRLGEDAEHKRVVELARQLPQQPNEDEYQQACFEALCGNADEALRLLKIALEKELHTGEFANNDSDFDFLKNDKRFQDLVRSKPEVM
jgi:tetratricopeptide (TPR) repeat protein